MSARSSTVTSVVLVAILLVFVASLLFTLLLTDEKPSQPLVPAVSDSVQVSSPATPTDLHASPSFTVSNERPTEVTLSCLDEAYAYQYADQFIDCVSVLLAAESGIEPLQALYIQWLDVDWEAALDHTLTLDPRFSSYLLPHLLKTLATTALYSAIDWLAWAELDTAFRTDLMVDIYQTLAEQDPIYAIAEVANLRDSDVKAEVINQLLERWAAIDAKAALVWVEAQPQPQFYMDQKQAILWRWVEQAPLESGEYIAAMPSSDMAKTIAAFYSHQLAQKNVDEAFEWLDTLESPAVYTAALIAVLELAVADSRYQQQAMDKAMSLAHQEDRDWAIMSIAVQMGANNLPELVDLYPSIPDTVKTDVATVVAMNWAEYSPEEAVSWAQSLPSGIAADKAKYVIGEHYISSDWQQAIAVAASIDAQAERLNLLKAIFEYAGQAQPEAAKSALDKVTGLSDRERQQLFTLFY